MCFVSSLFLLIVFFSSLLLETNICIVCILLHLFAGTLYIKYFLLAYQKRKKEKWSSNFCLEGWWLRNLGGGMALFCLRKNYLMLHFVYNNLLEKNNRIILVSRSESNKSKRKVLRFYSHSSVQCLVSLPMLKIKRTRGFDPLPSQLLPNELTFMFFICITCLVLYVVVHQVCV